MADRTVRDFGVGYFVCFADHNGTLGTQPSQPKITPGRKVFPGVIFG